MAGRADLLEGFLVRWPSPRREDPALVLAAYLDDLETVPEWILERALARLAQDPEVEFRPPPAAVLELSGRFALGWRFYLDGRGGYDHPGTPAECRLPVERVRAELAWLWRTSGETPPDRHETTAGPMVQGVQAARRSGATTALADGLSLTIGPRRG